MANPALSNPAVSIRGLSKRFGANQAVANLSLDVPRGSFYGLVGPNGAGKTTTIRMVTGLLRPDEGSAEVDGIDVWSHQAEVKARIGVLPEELYLFDRLTGHELVTFNGLIRGLDEHVVKERSDELLVTLGLESSRNELVVDYSHGMRKKVALACALIHVPRVLFLDEPFEAIDPVSSQVIRSVLARFAASGGTVLLSSHVMEIVERVCDHVAVLDKGEVLASGPTEQLRAGRRLHEVFTELVGADLPDESTLSWLQT